MLLHSETSARITRVAGCVPPVLKLICLEFHDLYVNSYEASVYTAERRIKNVNVHPDASLEEMESLPFAYYDFTKNPPLPLTHTKIPILDFRSGGCSSVSIIFLYFKPSTLTDVASAHPPA
jgi:hypothetical protein